MFNKSGTMNKKMVCLVLFVWVTVTVALGIGAIELMRGRLI